MITSLAINGSPRMEKGNTALLLNSFIRGMQDGGAEVELLYASRLKIKPCSCGVMSCWDELPGECCIKDEMQSVYPKLKEAEILVLATPVYIPLPGDMQNFINRLCPLLDPTLAFRDGRTRARLNRDVKIRQIVLISTSGWWEKANFATVVQVVEQFAADASLDFAGAVLRPHVHLMKKQGALSEEGEGVLKAAWRAGYELLTQRAITQATLDEISRPLISQEEQWRRYNTPS
jgi:multimeric flavodoxin WrbA